MLFSEDAFTKSSDWCPNPCRWHATDSDSTELEVTELVASFVRALQPELVIETGTAWGQTAKAIGEALAANGHGRLITCEPNPERHAHCVRLLGGLPVDVLPCGSLEFTPDRPVRFAWLDSLPHLRISEFRHLRPWLTPGAVVGIHDVAPHKRLSGWLDDFERDSGVQFMRLRTPRGVAFAQIP